MSTDLSDPPSSVPSHYPFSDQRPAQHPDGERAPIPVSREPISVDFTMVERLVDQAEHMRRGVRRYWDDPAWRPIAMGLRVQEAKLLDAMEATPDSYLLKVYLGLVRSAMKRPGFVAMVLRSFAL